MANEFGPYPYASGSTLKLCVFDSLGNVRDITGAAWVAPDAATFAHCLADLPERGQTGLYYWSRPDWMSAHNSYQIGIFDAGAGAASFEDVLELIDFAPKLDDLYERMDAVGGTGPLTFTGQPAQPYLAVGTITTLVRGLPVGDIAIECRLRNAPTGAKGFSDRRESWSTSSDETASWSDGSFIQGWAYEARRVDGETAGPWVQFTVPTFAPATPDEEKVFELPVVLGNRAL
jgi:hypothetical protein